MLKSTSIRQRRSWAKSVEEAARVVLGNRSAAVTEIYAELDKMKAAEIMEQVG